MSDRRWLALEGGIADGGERIAPDTLERAFEPPFTTRSEGTGLELAVVANLVEAHGSSGVESTVGRGTSLSIKLPEPTAERAA